jgi:hypothetical protein
MKLKKSGLIHLTEEASNSISEMLVELFKVDEHLKVNHSKLASFILSEYRMKNFEKAKSRLVDAHQDKKKNLKDAIEHLNTEELEATMKYLSKLNKTK